MNAFILTKSFNLSSREFIAYSYSMEILKGLVNQTDWEKSASSESIINTNVDNFPIYRICRVKFANDKSSIKKANFKNQQLLSKNDQSIAQRLKNGANLRVTELSLHLGVSKNSIWRWVKEGKFPAPVKLSEKVTIWKAEEIIDWLDKKGLDY